MKYLLLFLSFYQIGLLAKAQDLPFYKKNIDTLCSPYLFGRGYTKRAHLKTAHYIKHTLRKLGYHVKTQDFPITANTFPECSSLILNDSLDVPLGTAFIPESSSGSCDGTYRVFHIDSSFLADKYKKEELMRYDTLFAILTDHQTLKRIEDTLIKSKVQAAKLILLKTPKPLTGRFSKIANRFAAIEVLDSCLPKTIINAKLKLTHKIYEGRGQNVIAYQSFDVTKPTLYLTGHYDHLGGYGDSVYVSGANDNASGCAMLLNIAKDITSLEKEFNIVFLFFGGEEVGLVGSSFYATHPSFQFKKEKDRLINLDLMGAGSKGITIENGIAENDLVDLFESVNKELVPEIILKANRANSDHYPFTEIGVHSVFIFSRGDVGGYHNIFDCKQELEYESYNNLYKLIYTAILWGFIEET